MRITLTTGPFYPAPPAPCGAVERIWFDLARIFAARGHDVSILSSGAAGFPARQVIDGVRIHRVWGLRHTNRTATNLLKDSLYAGRALASLPRADVTVTNSFWLPAAMTRLPGRRRWGKVYVTCQRVPKGQIKLYLRADRLHAVSTAIARWIVEEQPRAAGITRVVPNPIDVRHFNAETGLAASGDPSTPTILYTGRVHPEKGLDVLMRALPLLREKVPGARLRVIGPTAADKGGGGEPFAESLRKLAGDLPVRFDPAIYDRGELAAALRSADVYCYPSLAEKGEASPVAPLEAMGVGLVPICSDLPQFRDYLREGENGVTFDHRGEGAPQRLADALASVLLDDDRRRAMAAAAARTAAGYSNEAVADLFLEDFRRLLAGGEDE